MVLSACATSSSAPPVVTRQPLVAQDDDVATAFEPEAAAKVQPTAVPPPPLPDLRAGFRQALEAGHGALAAKALAEAQRAAATATREAKTLGAADRLKAAELTFKVAFAGKDAEAARAAARLWLEACVGDAVDVCRAQALGGLASTGQLSLDTSVRDEVQAVLKAEACLKKSERARKAERCLADSEALAAQRQDVYLQSRAAYVRALAAPEGKRLAHLTAVDERCTSLGCLSVRRRALAELLSRARADRRVDEAARLSLRDAQLLATASAEPERQWVRTAEVDSTCAAYDEAHGQGACRKLERQITGRWTFRDFSKEEARDGLSADQVRTVNEHYAPLLQECLTAQARRLKPPDAVRYELRWMVFNDGRVGEVHFKDAAHERSALASCLREQFSTWRYPRYEGEWQHVEQAFTVTAVERR